jgi:hypothetical protein
MITGLSDAMATHENDDPTAFLSPFHKALAEQELPVIQRIRQLLPDIDAALRAGYTRRNVAIALTRIFHQ